MDKFTFTVAGKPRGKARPRFTKQGRTFTPKATAAAEREIAQIARLAMGSMTAMTGAVRLEIEAVFDVPAKFKGLLRDQALAGELLYDGKPDRDNIEKLVMDALNGVAWHDDCQVSCGEPIRRYGSAARTEVTVTAVDQPLTPVQKRRIEEAADPTIRIRRLQKQRKAADAKRPPPIRRIW